MGPIHALCLQLVAKSIIELATADDKRNLIGKTDLSPLNVIIRLVINGNDPAVMNDTAWEGLIWLHAIKQLFEFVKQINFS